MMIETAGHEVSDKRAETMSVALAAGADADVLVLIRDAVRVSRRDTIVLPGHRYENLSRGRGWARQGRGDNVRWGEKTDGGYRVGPGKWTVGATDGFRRKDSTDWDVRHISVGTQTWTIAS